MNQQGKTKLGKKEKGGWGPQIAAKREEVGERKGFAPTALRRHKELF